MRTFVIAVCYKETPLFRRQLEKLFRGVDVEAFVVVDTANDFSLGERDISANDLNALGEFTGYQYGLEKICVLKGDAACEVRCFVLNDTVFSGHFTYLFRRLVLLESNRISCGSSLAGMVEQRVVGSIIPSCFFVFSGTSYELDTLKLIGHPTFSRDVVKECSLYGDCRFQAHLERWLRPSSFFRGWYKAKLYSPLSETEFERKAVAICLEWSLVSVLQKQGVVLYDHCQSFEIRALKFVDKCYCNWLKARTRLAEFIHVKILGRKG